MSKSELHRYTCKIAQKKCRPISKDGEVVTFRAPVTQGGKQKLYVVMHDREFCYVGITKTSLSTRFRTGFKPNTSSGYHGYRWKTLKKVEVYVWMSGLGRKRTESIEAELVYLIRKSTGKWPLYQTEIHFHNPVGKVGDSDQRAARSLFKRLCR